MPDTPTAEALGARQLLRHALATLAYRGGKAVRGAPAEFASFRLDASSRTPAQILAHVGDLLDWALSLARGPQTWNNSQPLPWDQEIERFHSALERLDAHLASAAPLDHAVEKIFQGPVADALTHVGQLMMLRRLAGAAVRGENFAVANIVAGAVGSTQPAARAEF